jgi:hypothetical protein
MGFSALAELRGRDADALAAQYCRLNRRPMDPILTPCFAAVVRFAETGEPRPWWDLLRVQTRREREAVFAAALPA